MCDREGTGLRFLFQRDHIRLGAPLLSVAATTTDLRKLLSIHGAGAVSNQADAAAAVVAETSARRGRSRSPARRTVQAGASYLIGPCCGGGRQSIGILLQKNASADDALQSYCHALLLADLCQARHGKLDARQITDQDLKDAAAIMRTHWQQYATTIHAAGWVADPSLLSAAVYRVEWLL